jgi:Fic family protein
MNSYYSNLIEGQSTHPANIERALRADFSNRPDVARRQRLAVAHIEAERSLEATVCATPTAAETLALRSDFLIDAHRAMYGRLAAADRTTADGLEVQPGQLRQEDVTVGAHVPPAHGAVPGFLARMDEVYPRLHGLDALLYTVASAHHRATWVHPFGDGNGRACRLQSHCALLTLSSGLWSPSRGLARQRDRYYEMLAGADAPRQGDLDGRGNLSERGLRDWCGFFIDTCADQVRFMSRMLDLDGLRERMATLVAVRAAGRRHPHYRPEAAAALCHVLIAGPVSRGEFCRMTGLAERTARRLLAALLRDRLLLSDRPKGAVSIGFPLDALNVLFPDLYPEAATVNPEP